MQKIMFNDKYGLTEAVLAKRKTQTRRIITNKEYYDKACKRIKFEQAQLTLF